MLRKRSTPALFALEDRVCLNCVVPMDGELQVNVTTTISQDTPSVAMDADGDFTVIWRDLSAVPESIYVRTFEPDNSPVTSEIQVFPFTTGGNQSFPAIASDATGSKVVTWTQVNAPSDANEGILVRRVNADGSLGAMPIRANDHTASTQTRSAVAVDSDGDFIVVWQSFNQVGDGNYEVYAQRFDSSFTKVGSEIHVSSVDSSTYSAQQIGGNVALLNSGRSMIVWQRTTGGETDVYARVYDGGSPVGDPFIVHNATTLVQSQPKVSSDLEGRFVVTWTSNQGGNKIFARVFDDDGTPLTSDVLVSNGSYSASLSAVSMDKNGNSAVSWHYEDNTTIDPNQAVAARRLAADGTLLGNEFRVNTTTTDSQNSSTVAVDSDGDFVVAWASYDQLSSESRYDIIAQRYDLSGPTVASALINSSSTLIWSRISNVRVEFSGVVNLPANPADAFQLVGTLSGNPITGISLNIDLSQSTSTETVALITFSGTPIEATSLPDGFYTLTVLSNRVLDSDCLTFLDGDGDGLQGGNFAISFFRFFGDSDGNATVNGIDFAAFRAVFGTSDYEFDFDGDGNVTAADFAAFRARFGTSIVP